MDERQAERLSCAVEEVSNELSGLRQFFERWAEQARPVLESVAFPRVLANMPQSVEIEAAIEEAQAKCPASPAIGFGVREVSEELRKVRELLRGVYPDSPHNASWLVAKLIRQHKRALQKLVDIEAALDDHEDAGALQADIGGILDQEPGE